MAVSWYESLFDQRYFVFYEELLQGSGTADADVDFVERVLAPAADARVLDLGCGFGRHSVPLGRRGYRVTGVDLSEAMLAAGREVASTLGVQVDWVRRDMRELAGLGPFDCCVCLYTVLGYFDSDEEDERVLRGVHDVLKPGAPLMLDLSNPLALARHWPAQIWRETSKGVRREVSTYEPLAGRLKTKRTLFPSAGGRVEMPESLVRMYAPHEMRQMLVRAGFEVEQLFGDFKGQPFRWNRSVRHIWIARRR